MQTITGLLIPHGGSSRHAYTYTQVRCVQMELCMKEAQTSCHTACAPTPPPLFASLLHHNQTLIRT
jgi:hypothetical protein